MRRPSKQDVRILVGTVLAAAAAFAVIHAVAQSGVGPTTDEEYVVLDAVLKGSWVLELCVVDPLTVPENEDGRLGGRVDPAAAVDAFLSTPEPKGLSDRIARRFRPPRFSEQLRKALTDRREKSRKAWPVRGGITTKPNVVMLTPQERRELFKWKRPRWREFYQA